MDGLDRLARDYRVDNMPRNIKDIKLWVKNPGANNTVPLVKIEFNFPCTWTVLHIDDLKQILRVWIKGEEQAHPPERGYHGRWLLFNDIKRIFYDGTKRNHDDTDNTLDRFIKK